MGSRKKLKPKRVRPSREVVALKAALKQIEALKYSSNPYVGLEVATNIARKALGF